MKKHLIAWGILSTMFMANTFAQKDIDRPIMGWSSWNTYHVNISEELIKQHPRESRKAELKKGKTGNCAFAGNCTCNQSPLSAPGQSPCIYAVRISRFSLRRLGCPPTEADGNGQW